MPDAESATVELRDKLKWILDNTPGVLLYDALLAHTANAVIEAYVKGYEKGHIDSHEEGGSG